MDGHPQRRNSIPFREQLISLPATIVSSLCGEIRLVVPHERFPFYFFGYFNWWGLGDVMEITGTILPIFIVNLFKGLDFWLGIFQLLFLVAIEFAQWKWTARSWLPLRLASCLVAYLAGNSIYTSVVMLWPFLEIPYLLLFFTVVLPFACAVGVVFGARATRRGIEPAR
jgi:hypothetical protein